MPVKSEADLNPSQINAIEELRKRMMGNMDILKDFDQTFVFYRYLQARNWDINKAEIMLRNSVEFRTKIDVNAIRKDYQPREILEKYLRNFCFGFDKEGCPVVYWPLGRCDARGIVKSTMPNEIEKTVIKLFIEGEYTIEEKVKEKNRWLPGIVIIADNSGLPLSTATFMKGIKIMMRLGKIQQDHAPERLKAVFITNTPSFFAIPLNIFKQCMASETMRKFHIYGEAGWKEALLEVIDADQLPVFLGGTRTDPDGNPRCNTTVCHMGIIDKSYYLVKHGNPLENAPGAKKIYLERASTKRIPLEVTEAGSVIEWEFETRSGDIGFGLFYKGVVSDEKKAIEAVPVQRVDTTDFVETGLYKCDKPGKYFVLFDNSYSWVRSKELFYRIKVSNLQEKGERTNNENTFSYAANF